MTIDREDFDRLVREKQKEQVTEADIALHRQVREAAKPYAQLVNDPTWGPFRLKVIEWMMQARNYANEKAAELTDPDRRLSDADQNYLRIQIAKARSSADAWKVVLDYPTQEANKLLAAEEAEREVASAK